jgi:hypothetical protein
MVSPATAPMPLRLTVTSRFLSLVLSPLARLPVPSGTSSYIEVIVGALGAVVSSVMVKMDEGKLWLPAWSVIRTVM